MEESLKPPGQRRPLPQPPKNFDEVAVRGGGRNNSIDQFNEEAFKNFNEQALVPCEHCNRTFLPDRLPVHQRVCQKIFTKKSHSLHNDPKAKRILLGRANFKLD